MQLCQRLVSALSQQIYGSLKVVAVSSYSWRARHNQTRWRLSGVSFSLRLFSIHLPEIQNGITIIFCKFSKSTCPMHERDWQMSWNDEQNMLPDLSCRKEDKSFRLNVMVNWFFFYLQVVSDFGLFFHIFVHFTNWTKPSNTDLYNCLRITTAPSPTSSSTVPWLHA